MKDSQWQHLLNYSYLIDIRQLDTRILSSFQSEEMQLFFHFVGSRMQNDYSYRWNSIKDWVCLSLHPRSN
jgi:mRNA-degrading endonuclease RelE of RelBE toxin-antitoxin system